MFHHAWLLLVIMGVLHDSNDSLLTAGSVGENRRRRGLRIEDVEDSHVNDIDHGHGKDHGHGHGNDHGDDSDEAHGAHGSHFGYSRVAGPGRWARAFPTCGGLKQSPINLDTTTAVTAHRPHMSWWGYSLRPLSMALVNNGHTVVLKGEWPNGGKPYNWDSTDVNDFYIFEQLHFHWGPDDATGSEHTLNSEKFPLEMHAVHYRKVLGNLGAAAQVPGGLKVIGILFRISEHNNTALGEVLNGLNKVQHGPATASIPPFKLSRLIPDFTKQYLTYDGSLTTPPCSESVKWVVYKQPSGISREQVERFRHFNDDVAATIDRNFRPVQPLNGRIVQNIR